MHSYLRTVGFSKVKSRKEMQEIIQDVINTYDEKIAVENHPDGVFVQYSKNYGCDCGITVCGQYDEDNEFHVEYSFPFFRGTGITSQESVVVERHAEKESYAGICDEVRLGVTLIFYLQNVADYLAVKNNKFYISQANGTVLAALSTEGKILLPINKDEHKQKLTEQTMNERNGLIAAARKGDEDAIENLTLEDIDTYSLLSRRVQHEDILSIVDSYFMPYGIESDQYSILGEIMDCRLLQNSYTEENVYAIDIKCNDVEFPICINQKDLIGEPAVGRRFKGNIWLQGSINYRD